MAVVIEKIKIKKSKINSLQKLQKQTNNKNLSPQITVKEIHCTMSSIGVIGEMWLSFETLEGPGCFASQSRSVFVSMRACRERESRRASVSVRAVGTCAANSFYASRPTAGCLADYSGLAGPKGMCLCVIMSPSSGYFPVSPLFLKQPTVGVSVSLQRRAEAQGDVGMEGQCWEKTLAKGRARVAGSEEWGKWYHK